MAARPIWIRSAWRPIGACRSARILRLRRAIGRARAQSVLEEFDAGLNIPMRDGETRPVEKR